MKKKVPVIFILVLFFIHLPNTKAQLPSLEFNSGEKLEYVIYYGLITGGVATMKLRYVKFNGTLAYHCKAEAKSTGITDKLYKVKDTYESYFNPDNMLPYKSVRDINEGKYHKYDEAWYFHDKKSLRSKNSGYFDSIPADIRDMVSAFFYLRTYQYDTMKYGDIIKINTFFDDEVFPFDMRYRGREKVKTKLGEFDCIKLVPFVEPGRIFKTEEDMTIWICPELKYAPIRVKFDLLIGSLKIDLINHDKIE